MDTRTFSHEDYTVGWICALPVETAAAKLMLDEIHTSLPRLPTDENTYILGSIGKHNVVIASLPMGVYGNTSATKVATQLLFSFHAIRFSFMVGIGGGVPSSNADIRLGDIVVSQPTDTFGGVIQYDLGKALSGGEFKRTGMLNRPPQVLLTALTTLRAQHFTEDSRVVEFASNIQAKMTPHKARKFARPMQEDYLFQAEYDHVASDTCINCDQSKLLLRPPREHEEPVIHYGLIGSANQVVKDGRRRDQLARDLGIYCVEMEAAGLMNNFPCLVIRGICDYADSHKNKEWQGYAAAVAAAYAKELLSVVEADQLNSTPTARNTRSEAQKSQVSPSQYHTNLMQIFDGMKLFGRDLLLNNINDGFRLNEKTRFVGLFAVGGTGKSHIAHAYASRFRKDHDDPECLQPRHTFWINAGDESKLFKSCQEICRKVKLQSSENPLLEVKEWLEDEANGQWILIIDGLDSLENARKWALDFPRARTGRSIITTRIRGVLEPFTGLREETTLAVSALAPLDARKLFDSVAENTGTAVTDDDFQTLVSLVELPLLIKLSAFYLKRFQGGSVSIRDLNDALAKNIYNMKKLVNDVPHRAQLNTEEDVIFPLFSTLLTPFVNMFGPEDEEFMLLAILCCFACENLNTKVLSRFYSAETPLGEYLGVLSNHGFIEKNGEDGYAAHSLVQRLFLRYISATRGLGNVYVLMSFRWMLEGIFEEYIEGRERRGSTGMESSNSYFEKIKYMPHFEEFLAYTKCLCEGKSPNWRVDGWVFRVNTSKSIRTFSRAFATANRVDDAIFLLEFVKNHGIKDDTHGEMIDLLLSLATRLEERHSGRKSGEFLIRARRYSEEALKLAETANLPTKLWRVSIQFVRILIRMGCISEAHERLRILRDQFHAENQVDLPPNERIKFTIRLRTHEAYLMFQTGMFMKKKHMVVEARTILVGLLNHTCRYVQADGDLVREIREKLAQVDIEIPMPLTLEEAETIYGEILRDRQREFRNDPNHSNVVEAELSLAMPSSDKNRTSASPTTKGGSGGGFASIVRAVSNGISNITDAATGTRSGTNYGGSSTTTNWNGN
ncbi:hypothetical protein CNMCM5623_007084 [Aspergillus felis]|uniref:Nucleoside phosphorylase domain-containing protein n=1 Tax=Aspergillus felis TaxID=1287682 RepID=A0A8H6V596_9EURO|nr:hypothetical protein CNMCM5623_007084 [Aspergillus felis]